ncbi:MAG: glycosyltransferase family 1 protein [Pseudomonas sp.]
MIVTPESIAIGRGKSAAIKRQLWMRRLKFGKDELVYSPTHHGLPNQDGQIITIHDMICLRFPRQHLSQYIFFRYFVPRLLSKCRAVFTVSETSRRDIASSYGYALDRIHVVPNSVDTSRFTPGQVESRTPYLLMVGARYSHKNVDEVLRYAHLWKDKYRLVITSCSGRYRRVLERLIQRAGIGASVEFHDYISNEQLVRLYQGCMALIYPSKWEGFGIPPLEALACGRPVIVSDIEIHREVLDEAAFFVKLGDEESWRKALADLQDSARVNEVVAQGRGRLEYYTPDNSLRALEASLLAVEPALELA